MQYCSLAEQLSGAWKKALISVGMLVQKQAEKEDLRKVHTNAMHYIINKSNVE